MALHPGTGYQFGGQGTVAPTINGSTLTMTLRQALKTGHANHVRVIAGTDRDEDLVGTATSAAQYQSLVDTDTTVPFDVSVRLSARGPGDVTRGAERDADPRTERH